MLRRIFYVAGLVGAFAAGVSLGPRLRHTDLLGRRAAERRQSCHDDCEQNQLVHQLPDEVTRACIARCDQAATASERREPPGRITRAPADHHPEAVTEPGTER